MKCSTQESLSLQQLQSLVLKIRQKHFKEHQISLTKIANDINPFPSQTQIAFNFWALRKDKIVIRLPGRNKDSLMNFKRMYFLSFNRKERQICFKTIELNSFKHNRSAWYKKKLKQKIFPLRKMIRTSKDWMILSKQMPRLELCFKESSLLLPSKWFTKVLLWFKSNKSWEMDLFLWQWSGKVLNKKDRLMVSPRKLRFSFPKISN